MMLNSAPSAKDTYLNRLSIWAQTIAYKLCRCHEKDLTPSLLPIATMNSHSKRMNETSTLWSLRKKSSVAC